MDDAKALELFLSEVHAVDDPQRGSLMTGQVIVVQPQGVIVDLGLKRDGVIPRSDLDRLPEGDSELVVGDEIAVMVVDPIDGDGNLVVSVSQARESGDWLKAKRLLESDAIFQAAPISFNRGGMIVPFGRLRGFVPASHLSDLPRGLNEADRATHLGGLVGRTMPFKVLEVDPQRHRLVLSERKAIRQWRQEQKARIIESLKEGEKRNGVVTSLREFGAFVDIGGADGLIHISELAWEHVEDPGQVLKIGQEVEVLIIRLDPVANRIGLSLKRLQPSPWIEAAERIQPGLELDGVVSRQASSGLYVSVDYGIEGLVRISKSPQLPERGTCVQVRVVAFDPERERMSLELIQTEEVIPPVTVLEVEDDGR